MYFSLCFKWSYFIQASFFIWIRRKAVPDVNVSQIGMYITINKRDNAMNRNPKGLVLLVNILLIMLPPGLQNAVVSKTLFTPRTGRLALSSILRVNAPKDRYVKVYG